VIKNPDGYIMHLFYIWFKDKLFSILNMENLFSKKKFIKKGLYDLTDFLLKKLTKALNNTYY
jgi:hypothetical protein